MKGFTVLELMITLAIAALTLVLALPSLQGYSRAQAMKSAVRQLHNDLATARSEAILRNGPVISCPGSPVNGCSGSNDWSTGWIVFTDNNADLTRQVDETVIRHGLPPANIKITFSPGRKLVQFGSDGSTPGSNGSFTFCGPGGPDEARKLVLSNIGRIRRDEAPSASSSQCF